MDIKPLKKFLLLATIPLLLSGCGKKESPEGTESPQDSALEALPDTLKIKKCPNTYIITGIGSSGVQNAAIINNQLLTPGTEIDPGVVLSKIYPTYVIIIHENTEYLIRPEDIQNELDEKKD